jgi:hypothetical protein
MLVEHVLITQALRPVPRAPMLLVDEQKLSHGLKRYAQARIKALKFRANRGRLSLPASLRTSAR